MSLPAFAHQIAPPRSEPKPAWQRPGNDASRRLLFFIQPRLIFSAVAPGRFIFLLSTEADR
jgi:hypothetical protein